MKHKPIISASQAARLVKQGDSLLVGGFGMTGHPVHILHELAATDIKDLSFIGNNVGEPNLGGGRLLRNGQIKKITGSFFSSNPDAVKAAQSGKVSYQIIPQGTLAEAIRAGGAGIGGFYTRTSVGTDISREMETKQINGMEYVFVPSIRANVALIRAWKADPAGNLQYRMTEQNFNPLMATAADLVIAEVEEIGPPGSIPPDKIHTPACYVDYLVQASLQESDLGTSSSSATTATENGIREKIAQRALRELSKGDIVNLGIGIPTLIADYLQPGDDIVLHSENGMLGVGPAPVDGRGAMHYPVNAGKLPVTSLAGTSYFDSAASFAMIRGGHIDVTIMGGLQVDETGNLANWAVPGKPLLGIGGAMDLAAGARKLIVLMTHTNKDGSPKLVRECTLPLTARQSVDKLITDLAVFEFRENRMYLTEVMPGSSEAEIHAKTEAQFQTDLK